MLLTPVRRLAAVAAVAALALTGCGDSSTGGSDSGSGALDQVKVTEGGDKEPPKIELTKKPLTVTTTEVKVLKEGTGEPVTDKGIATVNAAIVNGKDGKVIDETWSATGPVGIDMTTQATLAAIRTSIAGKKVGTRLLVAAPPKDAFGEQGRSELGVGPGDSVVFLIDIISTVTPLAQATGKEVAPQKGLPQVEWHADKAATITIPKDAKAPGKLTVAKLIEGSGPKVEKGRSIRVSYTGVLWDGAKSFDSSMTRDPAWYEFMVGEGKVIPGWDKALEGANVGDRLLLVIPPADGYGASGNPNSNPPIKGSDTLVFVVDVLATY